jgi:ABC-2 type transport system permease protein
MDKLMAVIRREYLERVRSKWFVIATIFGPVFIGALMFLPTLISSRDKGNADSSNIIIVDATGVGLGERVSTRLAGGVSGTGKMPEVIVATPATLPDAEARGTQAVVAETVKGYLVLDSMAMAGASARYSGSNTTALFDMQKLERAVRSEVLATRIASAGIDPEVGRQLMDINLTVKTERLTRQGRGGSGQVNIFLGLAVAVVLYMTIFIYGLNVMRGVLEEKQSRVAEVVISSISPTKLLLGKVLGVGGVGLTQLLLWTGMAWGMYQLRQPILAALGAAATPMTIPQVSWGMAAVLIGFFVLGFMLYAGLFAAVGATVNSEQEAQQAQMPVVLLLISSMMFAQNVMLQPDGTLARVLSLLPFSAPIVMPLRMTVAPVDTLDIGLALLSVALGAVGTVMIASRIYRTGLLMYGKRPSIREVFRWLRTN